jgi:hypothetical protein
MLYAYGWSIHPTVEVTLEDTLISVATGLISALTIVMLFEIAILM